MIILITISLFSNLSADKVKRLSLIRDKQEAIKFFLSEIAEEGESTTTNCLTPSSERYATKSIVSNLNSIEEKPDQDISSPIKSNNNTINNNNDIETKSIKMANTNEETTMIDENNKNNLLDNLEQHVNGSNGEHVDDLNGHNDNLDDLELIKTNQTNNNNTLKENQKFELNFNSNENLNNEENTNLVNVDTKLNSDINNLVNSTNNQLLDIDKLDTISNRTNDLKLDDDIEILTKPKSTAVKTTSSVRNGDIINIDASNDQITKLMNELNEMKERERGYLDKIDTLEEENKKFKMVAVEFESVFHQLIKDKDDIETKLKNEIIELTKERDHLQEDVVGVERAFDDLHRRFEKLKVKVEEFKKVCLFSNNNL
jgi:hypothetical protein